MNYAHFVSEIKQFLFDLVEDKLESEDDSKPINEVGAEIASLANTLMNSVEFTHTHVPSYGVAYTVFGRMNDRGMPLSVSDLLRNFVLEMVQDYSTPESSKELNGLVEDA